MLRAIRSRAKETSSSTRRSAAATGSLSNNDFGDATEFVQLEFDHTIDRIRCTATTHDTLARLLAARYLHLVCKRKNAAAMLIAGASDAKNKAETTVAEE